jgi:DNA repair protein RecN (Recombination protein N)
VIEKLIIKNYLIIKEAELNFLKGLNILTGETGAGKTIILDALSLILGERADYSKISRNNDKLVIEGHFEFKGNKNVSAFLKENGISFEDTGNDNIVILRRELFKKGISRNFINDNPVPLNILKSFGDIIIDIHSQNEHQSLLKKESHIDLLDSFINNEKIFSGFDSLYSNYKELIYKFEDVINKKDSLLEKKSYIEYQLKEINNVNPIENEDEELESELKKLENSEEISLTISSAISILYENEGNAIAGISNVIKELKKIVRYDSELEKTLEELESSYVVLKDAADYLNNYNNSLNFDSLRTEQIRDRLGSLNFLRKKYNLTVNDLIDKAKKLTEELNYAENFDFEIEKLEEEIETKREVLFKKALEISELRKKAIKSLEKSVNSYLGEVGLESAEFKAEQKLYENSENGFYTYKKDRKNIYLSSKGIDDIEFLIKTNKGAEFSPLRKTASGGEISRIMLAIKSSLSGKDNIPVLVFDEIDSGISGRIADKVGKLIKTLSESHQIISITHLPQIAAMSDNHFHVSKRDFKNETVAEIRKLNEKEKVEEIAKLLSGEKVTESSIKSAKELIKGK